MTTDDPAIPTPQPAEEMQVPTPKELFARGLETPAAVDGAREWTPPSPRKLAEMLPQYHIEGIIGRGGMGAVYRGFQPSLDRAVAIKLLPAALAEDGKFIVRFQREARTLAKLHHPGIVAIHDFGETREGDPYFVMEFVDGADLAQIIKNASPTPAQTLDLTIQICDALQYAHSLGLVHRDIKPANILVNTEGRAKLADFGLARPVQAGLGVLTVSDIALGTTAYMAPEQREGHADHRADIFALGVTLYEMLTGKRPEGAFDMPSVKVQTDVRLDTVVLKALQQEPDRRYQHARDMRTEVKEIQATPAQGRPPRDSRATGGATKRFSSQTLVLAGVLVLLIIVGGFLRRKGDRAHGATAAEPGALASSSKSRRIEEHAFVELDGPHGFLASPGVPADALTFLKKSSEDPRSDFRCFAFTETGDWVFLCSGTRFCTSDADLAVCKALSDLQKGSVDFQCVAFAPTGGFTVFFGGNGSWTQGPVPEAAYNKIQEVGDRGEELRSVAYGPNGSWVLLFGKTEVAYGDLPADLDKVLGNAVARGQEVRCVAFAGKDWICLTESGQRTSSPGLLAEKTLGRGTAAKWIAFLPESASRP